MKPPVQCGNCGAAIAFAPGQLVGDPTAVAEVESLARDAEALAEALRETLDLCNAMREYVPTLNMAAEKRLRDSLALVARHPKETP